MPFTDFVGMWNFVQYRLKTALKLFVMTFADDKITSIKPILGDQYE